MSSLGVSQASQPVPQSPTPSMTSPPAYVDPEATYIRHDTFYLADGNMIFLVEGDTLFNVHESCLTRDPESVFTTMLTLEGDGTETEGMSDNNPIILPQVSADDFADLLRVLYALTGVKLKHIASQSTAFNWPTVYRLADQWSMTSLYEDLTELVKAGSRLSVIDNLAISVSHPTIFDESTRRTMFMAAINLMVPLTMEQGARLGGYWMAAVAGAREARPHRSNIESWFNTASKGARRV